MIVKSLAVPPNSSGVWHQVDDTEVNDDEEERAKNSMAVPIPSKLKAVIKFGYEETMKSALGDEDFDSYIASVLTHTQVYFRHESLGTIIEFDVSTPITFRSQ